MSIPSRWSLMLFLAATGAGCGGAGSSSTPQPDLTAPTVSSTVPVNAATSVAMNGSITATFSQAMTPATLTDVTFTLKHGTTAVAGTVTFSGAVATMVPSSPLAAGTVYTATITMGAMNMTGVPMAAPFTWSFTTGAAADTTPPTVSSTVPASGASGVAFNAAVTATFSEGMTPASLTAATFTLLQGTTPVTGTVSNVGLVATFSPSSALAANTIYTATISVGSP